MELWDARREDGTVTGTFLRRGEPIPRGLYHMVCEVLVQHTDGDYLIMKRAASKDIFPGWYEATSGGSALVGEDAECCIRRELAEETGIKQGGFTELSRYTNQDTHFVQFLCVTDWDKDAITLQEGETEDYLWVSPARFARMIAEGKTVVTQAQRFASYYRQIGLIP